MSPSGPRHEAEQAEQMVMDEDGTAPAKTPRLRRWVGMRRRRTPIPWLLSGWFSRIVGSVEAVGVEHIPPEGAPCIVAFNHPSRYDGVLVFAVIPRHDVATLVTGKMRRFPVRKLLVEIAGGVWVEPGGSEDTIQTMLDLATAGWALMLAPEGQTTGGDGLVSGKRGVGFLALHAGVPVVPAAVSGSAGARLWRWPPGQMRARILFGEPFNLPPLKPEHLRDQERQATDGVMCRIAALLPREERGVYTETVCAGTEQWLAAINDETGSGG
ncbi:MAG: lysophospholipid acyltransferase family protein [Thermomicrobiales bacterium]